MSIYQYGQLNTTALSRPDLYVQIVPPQVMLLNGVPTNIGGVVGSASWGPVNSPVRFSDPYGGAQIFGTLNARKYDLMTAVTVAALQGKAGAYVGVRVTDGTDTAATGTVGANGTLAFWQAVAAAINTGAGQARGPSNLIVATGAATNMSVTAKYTGTLGEQIKVTIAAGAKAGTYRAIVSMPGSVPEIFDNIALASGTAPTLATYSLTGGADGAGSITASIMLGTDTAPRTGMYALRNMGCSVGLLADLDDVTSVAAQQAFGLDQGIYFVYGGPSGQAPSDAITAKSGAGIDTYAIKWIMGDWITFNDTANKVQRKVSPASFAFGRYVNLAPHMSGLNKAILGVVATEKSAANQVYSDADISALYTAGIDVICNPVPAGSFFGLRTGRNASSDTTIRGDNYTRMTNYIAATVNSAMGKFVGELQSRRANDNTRRRARSTLDGFLSGMQQVLPDPMIDDFQVILDKSINSDAQIAAGYMIAYVKVVYMSIVEFFVVNIEGGQSVQITRQGVFSTNDNSSAAFQSINQPFVTGAAA